MTHVAFLQRWFADAVTTEQEPSGGAVERLLTRGPRMTARERLDVYRSGYRGRLIECLADDYPALKHLLREDRFDAIASLYIDAHPSRSPSLNAFGATMPAFLAESGLKDAAFASDLARLEWALVEAIHAAHADPITPERLAEIAPETWVGARLQAAPSVQVLRFRHPVDGYYQAFRDGRDAGVATGATATLVHRHGWVVWRRDLTPPMAAVLDSLVGGAHLGDALGLAADAGGDPVDVTGWFKDWVGAGVFVAVETA